mmetsp:Transcript_8589/g.17399  ORF Transcript_8589/g.17399 Transcript_8589/m.17399 type:complete len:216 (-) Transcript_8589:171-818(-)
MIGQIEGSREAHLFGEGPIGGDIQPNLARASVGILQGCRNPTVHGPNRRRVGLETTEVLRGKQLNGATRRVERVDRVQLCVHDVCSLSRCINCEILTGASVEVCANLVGENGGHGTGSLGRRVQVWEVEWCAVGMADCVAQDIPPELDCHGLDWCAALQAKVIVVDDQELTLQSECHAFDLIGSAPVQSSTGNVAVRVPDHLLGCWHDAQIHHRS